MYGRTSYTAQNAWIRNASVRDNILMGREHDSALYAAIIAACALQSDFDLLAAGDSSEPDSLSLTHYRESVDSHMQPHF